jgi:hypothetical protein
MLEENLSKSDNGVLQRWTYRYPFDHQSQATLAPVSTGDRPNDK